MWIAGVISLAIAAVSVIVLRRLRTRAVAVERHTQFGMSAVDPAIAERFRAAWEPPAPRTSRTRIGYAVVPPREVLRTSGLRDPDAAYERTAFDDSLPDYVESHYRATRTLRVTKTK